MAVNDEASIPRILLPRMRSEAGRWALPPGRPRRGGQETHGVDPLSWRVFGLGSGPPGTLTSESRFSHPSSPHRSLLATVRFRDGPEAPTRTPGPSPRMLRRRVRPEAGRRIPTRGACPGQNRGRPWNRRWTPRGDGRPFPEAADTSRLTLQRRLCHDGLHVTMRSSARSLEIESRSLSLEERHDDACPSVRRILGRWDGRRHRRRGRGSTDQHGRCAHDDRATARGHVTQSRCRRAHTWTSRMPTEVRRLRG